MEVPLLNATSPRRPGINANIVDTKNVKHVPMVENIDEEEIITNN